MMQKLASATIDAIAEMLVPGPPANLWQPGTPRVIDNRGKVFTHGWAKRTAFDAGTAPVTVLGGIYGCDDQRIATEGWHPVKTTATGDDCLKIRSAQNAHFEIVGAAVLATHDGIAPSKGPEANAHQTTYEIRDCYAEGQRDELGENDASLRGRLIRCRIDNTYQLISMRNPGGDARMKHKGHTHFETVICRFGAQPDPRAGHAAKANVPEGYGGGGLIIKAGSMTGTADYLRCLFLWNARHNAHREAQGIRPGIYKDVFALYAPYWKPQKMFMPLPKGWTDLGVHENALDVWFACCERWNERYDCDPGRDWYGWTGQKKGQKTGIPKVKEPWPYDWSPKKGATPAPKPVPEPEPGPKPQPKPVFPVKLSGDNDSTTVRVPVEMEAGAERAFVTMTVEDPDWPTEGELWHGDELLVTLFGGAVTGAGYDRKTVDLMYEVPATRFAGKSEVELEIRWLETAGFTIHAMAIEGKRPDEEPAPTPIPEPEPRPDPVVDLDQVRELTLKASQGIAGLGAAVEEVGQVVDQLCDAVARE